MNVLFLTLLSFDSLEERNIYADLLREFVKNGHKVYVISPVEKRLHQNTHLIEEKDSIILRLQIGNTQKTNIIEKGISTIMIEPIFKRGIEQYFSNVKFDLVLYSTPPITLVGAIEYVKKRDGAKTYLLLKDIFPQNAVDIGMMSTSGLRGILYRRFRNKEKRLYEISDRIGCMSLANVNYVLEHNPDIDPIKVEICPNSIEVIDKSINTDIRNLIRKKYDIPFDKTVFVYGGNLGKPQGVPFILECLKKCKNMDNAYFIIVGDGTEYGMLEEYYNTSKQNNLKLMKSLPKHEYDALVGACDVGMLFLDNRFTIPNFPSRMLSYMQARLPILACTDSNTDVGKTIIDGEFGWWCESNNADVVQACVSKICNQDLKSIGLKAFDYLNNNYTSSISYDTIIDGLKK